MCELFGVSAPEKIHINELLERFFAHGTEHPHGWGLAFFEQGNVAIEKQPEASYKSVYLKQRLRVKIEADQMFAHIRLATKGSTDYENCHPFSIRDRYGRAWTMIHNGTIFESEVLKHYVRIQHGGTDSERILLYIVDCINRAADEAGRALDAAGRFAVIDRVMDAITPENKVNILLYDGELFYAHTNLKDSLYISKKGRAAVFSTRPLDFSHWEPLPLNTLQAYDAGTLVYTGTDHGNEFFETEEKMRLLFMDYAGL